MLFTSKLDDKQLVVFNHFANLYSSSNLKFTKFLHVIHDYSSKKIDTHELDLFPIYHLNKSEIDIILLNFFVYKVFANKKSSLEICEKYLTFGVGLKFRNDCTHFYIETSSFRKYSLYDSYEFPIVENVAMVSTLIEKYHEISKRENFLQYSMLYEELNEFKNTSAHIII